MTEGTLSCGMCGRREDARSMGEQLGVNLCRSCDGMLSDEELMEWVEEEVVYGLDGNPIYPSNTGYLEVKQWWQNLRGGS